MDLVSNESLKYIVRAKDLIKDFLEKCDVDKDDLLSLSLELLEKAEEILTKKE